jgi:hypothetical protein
MQECAGIQWRNAFNYQQFLVNLQYIAFNMKRIFFAAAFIAAAVFQSCDYVVDPLEDNGNTGGGNGGGGGGDTLVRKVLIEDYTGHTCGNCPEAALAIEQIKGLSFGDQVVPVAVHAGFFAWTSGSLYSTNFQTATGTTYDNFFGISAVGNPNGMVNRMDYNTSHIKPHGSWSTIVSGIVNTDPDVNIEINNTYDSNTKQLITNVETKFLNSMNGTYKLVVLLIEDSIVAPQKNYALPSPSNDTFYVHRHVLRDVINTAWGDTVGTGTISAGLVTPKNYVYNGLASNSSWKPNKCYVVAYVYDVSNYRVIQAEEKKMKQ